jgi:hypothetical protein
MRQQLFDTAAYAHRGGRSSPALLQPAPGRLFDPAPFAATRPATAQSVSNTMGGTQQKMFMTPREIHAGWSPLDADREASYEGGTYEGSYQPKSWDTGNTMPGTYRNTESTGTLPLATAGYTQQQRRVPGIHSGEGGDDTGTIRRTRGGGKYRLYGRGQDDTESDEQLWDRKLEESQEFGKHGQHEDAASDPLHRGGRGSSTMGTYQGEPTGASQGTPSDSAYDRHYARENSWENRRQEARYDQGESLYDSIASEGVRGPIRLGQEIGSMGKPQIVGGHHRLAAATNIDPHRLVPVLHDWSIHSARQEASRGGYPYA